MDKYVDELASVTKGQVCIAEALKELETVKEAFIRSSRIEQKILYHDTDISEIKLKLEILASHSCINSKNSEIKQFIENSIDSRLEEYSYQMMKEMNRKISEEEAKHQLDLKAPWQEVNKLRHNLDSLKMKLDSYLEVEYPAHKAKLKSKFSELNDDSKKDSKLAQKLEILQNVLNQLQEKVNKIEELTFLEDNEPPIIQDIPRDLETLPPTKVFSDKKSSLLRKIEILEKNFSATSAENLTWQSKIGEIEQKLKLFFDEIQNIQRLNLELEQRQKELKSHFIKCLRNKDMQNQLKKDGVQIKKLPGPEVSKIHKAISDKNHRIVMIENGFKHINTEVEYMNQKLVSKFSEFYKYLESLEKTRITQGEEFKDLKTNIGILETTVTENLAKFTEDLSPGRNIFRMIESEDKKIKGSFESIKGLSDEFARTLTPVYSRRAYSKISERITRASSRIIKKHRN